jgi:hypothetical protein
MNARAMAWPLIVVGYNSQQLEKKYFHTTQLVDL